MSRHRMPPQCLKLAGSGWAPPSVRNNHATPIRAPPAPREIPRGLAPRDLSGPLQWDSLVVSKS